MNPLTPTPTKTRIKVAIRTFLGMFKPGDRLLTDDIIRYCHTHVTRYIRDDTILRYLREMREDGEVNYDCTSKRERHISIIDADKAHSL